MLVWNEIQEKSALSSVSLKATKLPAKEIPGAPNPTLKIYSRAFDVPANPSFVLNADVSRASLETQAGEYHQTSATAQSLEQFLCEDSSYASLQGFSLL